MTEGIHGFSSPRAEAFPSGLRVLVVDDDPTWLKILEKMLKKCSYEVTTCGLAIEALDLLRGRKYKFDIVISDVNMPDMDGFKLLEHVGLEMDLPVIMMSVDGETSRVMRGVQHGACDYLLKPIRMKELQNIWQHVFRKKIHEVRDFESHEGLEEILMMRNVSEQSDDMTTGRKRKDTEYKHDDIEFSEHSSSKKARVVWTVDLHQKFVKAVNHIGFEKVGPKKILDMMNVPRLTRENVASHLQKYRLYLSRLQKDNDLKTSSNGLKHSDISQIDAVGDHPNPINNNAVNSYQTPNNLFLKNIHKTIASSTTNPNKVSTSYASESQKASSLTIGIGSTQYSTYDSPLPTQYSWNSEVSEIQFDHGFNNGFFRKEKDKQEKSNIKFDSFPLQSHKLNPNFRPPDDYVSEPTSINDFEGQYFSSTNLETRIKGAPGYTNQDFIAEVPSNLYESLRFDYEYPPDSLEYPIIDQALFIV